MKTEWRAWTAALVAALFAAAALIKLAFFPSINDADFTLNDRNLLDAPADLVLIRPTHYSFLRHQTGIDFAWWPGKQAQWRAVGRDVPLRRALAVAYDTDQFRVILPPDAPANCFDFLVTYPTNQQQHLRQAILRTLGYTAHEEAEIDTQTANMSAMD